VRFARPTWRWAKAAAISVYYRSVYGFFLFAATLALFYVVQFLYFQLPASWFLDYYRAEVTSTVEGQDVPVELCRVKRYDNIQASATRTFYKADPARQNVPTTYRTIGSYEYHFKVEAGPECQSVFIRTGQFKHTPGTWRMHTDVTFKVNGVEKTTSYDSSAPYVIYPAPSVAEQQVRLQEQIDELQRQLHDLRERAGLPPLTPAPSVTRDSTETPPTNQNTTPPAGASPGPGTSAPTNDPLLELRVPPRDLLNGVPVDRRPIVLDTLHGLGLS
jgi:hypothetical protein